MAFKLENNPLENSPLFAAAPEAKKPEPVPQEADETRATFIVQKDLLRRLKNLAYTERRTIKEVLNDMLERELDRIEAAYKKDGREVLTAPEEAPKPRKKRKNAK